MDPELPASGSSSVGPGTPSNLRKERGAIAAQACETCRSRKQKCDEQRPKCGTCQKFGLDCRYREPQPTKKDKTLVEILDRLKSMEGKIDGLGLRASFPPSAYGTVPTGMLPSQGPLLGDGSGHGSLHPPTLRSAVPSSPASAHPGPYLYASSIHKMLAWPVVQQLLESAVPKLPKFLAPLPGQDSAAVAFALLQNDQALPHYGVESLSSNPRTALGTLQLQVPATANALPLSSSSLNWDTLQRLSKMYFDTFNLLYPIMDRETFNTSILPAVVSDGFDDSTAGTLACLVLALGEVAVAGTDGTPIGTYKGRGGGIKGGAVDRPPGLAFFNEARKRMGFSLAECSLENVQMYALAGLYYGSCCHHIEFWRMTMSASLACQALITSNPGILTSPRADLVRRAFWHCSIMETCINLELELPTTGLDKYEDVVGLPDFSGPFGEEDYVGNQATHFQEHFASQIVLRRLSVNFHGALTAAFGANPAPSPLAAIAPPDQTAATSTATVKQLTAELDQWRGMLPAYLRWQVHQPEGPSASSHDIYSPALFPPASLHEQPPVVFSPEIGTTPAATYPYAADVHVALLRTKYYHTKYLLYQPFVYKALHHSNLVTQEDAEGVAECLRACLKWPITMSPTSLRKRLVPCLFFWTNNILSILIIFHLSQHVPILMRVRKTLCGATFELEASQTVSLCIEWMRDLKSVDPTARWSWSILSGLYRLED